MLPFSVTNILQCTYIHTHLFHQFRGLIPGNPINNLKFPHFPLLQATLTTVCREVEDAHHTQSPKQFTWKEARNTTENMQPLRAPLVQTLQKAAQGTVLFSCTALVLTNSLAPKHMEGMGSNQSWGSTAALVKGEILPLTQFWGCVSFLWSPSSILQ